MNVGIHLAPRQLPSRPRPLDEVYREYIDDAVYAESVGFDSAWASEHHFAPDQWAPSALPLLAHLAAKTTTLQLGTNVFVLALHNPLRVAEDAACVDLLSGGRLTGFVVGSGSIADEFETFAVDHQQRWGRLFEGLGIIRRCFSEEEFDHEGKYFRFPNIRMTTKPVQNPFPLWVGGFGPKLLARAGREGYHLQGGFPATIKLYLQALVEAGHDPAQFNHQEYIRIHVASDRERAWDECQEGMHHYRSFYTDRQHLGASVGAKPVPAANDLRYEPKGSSPQQGMAGTPDDILADLEPRLAASRTTHLVIGFRQPGMTTDVVRSSMDLFVREVLPVVRTWGRKPVRSHTTSISPAAGPTI